MAKRVSKVAGQATRRVKLPTAVRKTGQYLQKIGLWQLDTTDVQARGTRWI